jgi:hypothetical protein
MKKMLFGGLVVAVMLSQPGVTWAAFTDSGELTIPASWGGTLPTPTTTCYIGPNGSGVFNVSLNAGNTLSIGQTIFDNITVDIMGTLNVNGEWSEAGRHYPSIINISGNGELNVTPDVFALAPDQGTGNAAIINVSGNGVLNTQWPYFFNNNGSYINLTDNAYWQTTGLWFPQTQSNFPSAGANYGVSLSGTAEMFVSADTWSPANAQAAISSGFITGSDLIVSTYTAPDQSVWTEIQSVPEPGTMMLLGIGGLLLIVRCKRS